MSIVEIATSRARSVDEVARLHFYLGEELRLGLLLEQIIALPRNDRWQTMARAAARDTSIALMQRLPGGARVWSGRCGTRAAALGVAGGGLGDRPRGSDRGRGCGLRRLSDLAMLSMALRAIRTLVGSRTRMAGGRVSTSVSAPQHHSARMPSAQKCWT